jgi:flavin reductase (DIM6/NTAB) family NADH-FMN oxidoreductase RutF
VEIDPGSLPPNAMYKLMIGCVVPRPIAWVSSVDTAGLRNIAPFSYFMAITDEPPTIAFSCSARAAGKKDTLRNVEATREFVVNVVDDPLASQMNVTSGDYPPEVDEFAVAGLAVAPAARVKAPRVAGAPIAMECRLDRNVPVGRAHLVLGQIVYLHLRDGLYDAASGRIDMHRLRPVGRLAGNLYAHIHDIFEMKRPNADYRG